MSARWDPELPGILRLPSGRLVRGRGLARPQPEGLLPDLGLYLLADEPEAVPWESRWLRWPDFGLPADRDQVLPILTEAWHRAEAERVEVACLGGRGRTGTALACLAIIDGLPPRSAVSYVRQNYSPRAVETFWQRRYVTRFRPA
jgi:protein-tyrosine phosphatase